MEETIMGVQSTGVQACAKHWVAYEQEVSLPPLNAPPMIRISKLTVADSTKPYLRRQRGTYSRINFI